MNFQGRSRLLCGYLLISLLAVFVVGCSGSGGDTGTPSGSSSVATSSLIINAEPGPIVAVRVGNTATLDGSKSNTSTGEAPTFAWSFSYKPETSKAELISPESVSPSFVADVRGTYMVQLVVSARGVSSQRAIQTVIATVAPERETGPFNHQGLSSKCGNCHDGVKPLSNGDPIVGKSQDHVATSNNCQACHTTLDYATIPYVDHHEVFGACSECHDGVSAIGKSEWHLPTTAECDECHTTVSFLELEADGSFDHSGITRVCSTCHNGSTATGKHATHIVTNKECGYCHNTVNFKDAFVDHSTITTGCAACHNGTDATGQTVGHPVTTGIECNVCHSTATFDLGGVFDHSVVGSNKLACSNCHNGTIATGKTSDHVVTTSDCGNCHNTTAFTPVYLDHTTGEVVDHSGFVDNCAVCHNGTDAIGKSVNHIDTVEDCSVCHTPGTFTSGVFDHSPAHLSGRLCADCHNNTISGGKPDNHIATTEDCGVCHTTTSFKGAVFNHVGIDPSNCASCHDGITALGKKVNHIPTTEDCSVCHAVTTAGGFATSTFLSSYHLGITTDCETCHNGILATGKKRNHIAALNTCSLCHSTDTFASTSKFLGSVHIDITSGCEGCHTSRVLPTASKSTGHLPTNQDCDVCHTNDTFSPAITPYTHPGITNNCSSCHNGNYETSYNARGKTPTHPTTTQDCGVCHNTTNFADAFVDHTGPDVVGKRCDSCHNGTNAAGKNTGHIATTQDCGICHEAGGSFATAVFDHSTLTTERCDSCHGQGKTAKTYNPTTHIPIPNVSRGNPQDCSVCHNTTAFAGAKFDHKGITNNCATCHDGSSATGKPTSHVPTNKDCSVCHQTTGFLPATFDHTGIVDNCRSCHDGVLATGKSAGHVATNQDCGVCHTTRGFIPATFDHSTVSASTRCDSCHGVTATGKSTNHIATSLDCRSCHTTATFVGGTWTHDSSSTGRCKECHDGTTATGQPPTGKTGHFATTAQCDVCHSTTAWAPAKTFKHTTTLYPGNHNSRVTCISCHTNNSETITYRSPTYKGFCAACHSNKYRTGDHNGRTLDTNKDCGRSGCHRVNGNGF